eukprot:31524-Pelagococcus_subviridis.AAC.15
MFSTTSNSIHIPKISASASFRNSSRNRRLSNSARPCGRYGISARRYVAVRAEEVTTSGMSCQLWHAFLSRNPLPVKGSK